MTFPTFRAIRNNFERLIPAIALAGMTTLIVLADTDAAQAQRLERLARSEIHMGVEFEIVLYTDDRALGEAAFQAAFKRIAELNSILSDYDPDSELSRLGARSGQDEPVNVSDELFAVLGASQRVSHLSDGAFDVTVGHLTKLWRRARRQKELPPMEMVTKARETVGYESIVLNERTQTALLKQPDMRLDLGGLAKGYAADEALAVLRKHGMHRALVRASGDIVAGDPPPGETGWKVGIAPLDPQSPPQRFVLLANAAISTSGDSRQHLVVDGRRYSHLIDPRTGSPVEGRSSVSVIAPQGMLADSLASAVSVLGPEKGLEMIRKLPNTAALVVWQAGDEAPTTAASPNFKCWEADEP